MVNIQEDNERTGESSPDSNTPLKEMNPSIQNAQQLETALRELLKRQTREAEIASDAMKKADEGDETGDSRSRMWKPSTVIGKPPVKENSKHSFSLEILSKELPKKFKYPVDMEPYDGTSDPKHHLDVFDNRMRVLKNFITRRKLPKICMNLCSVVQKPEETLRSYLDRFSAECTRIEGLQCQDALMALVKGLREDTPFLKSLIKRPPKTMEEIQDRSHEYLQQEEGQIAVKTDRDKRETRTIHMARNSTMARRQCIAYCKRHHSRNPMALLFCTSGCAAKYPFD
ncbi:hypothetical protein PIB30_006587 [Stylosanthes scabra]|uniref:Retrotransposon gag domain-containing protein n=1 Tax=Stylosanthes scabra TaxID=79078 RepID=A0ABU6Y2Y4_9FABA|nr:hypothetical protein [Stylosanthes scabra]